MSPEASGEREMGPSTSSLGAEAVGPKVCCGWHGCVLPGVSVPAGGLTGVGSCLIWCCHTALISDLGGSFFPGNVFLNRNK